MKKVLFIEAQKLVDPGGDNACAHGSSLDLEEMLGVQVLVSEDELGELDKELSAWKGMGAALLRKCSRAERPWG